MRTIKPQVIFENPEEVDEERVLRRIERYGRTCYKSEDRITEDSARRFVENLIAGGHLSVLDHEKVTVRVICDRGVTHEIVRHRIAAYSQESTRYCNYAKGRLGSEIAVIGPPFFDPEATRQAVNVLTGPSLVGGEARFVAESSQKLNEFDIWHLAMLFVEGAYMTLINDFGRTAQEARSVLPNSLKTEIVITYDLTEWRHFLRLRTTPNAHPQMRQVAVPILATFKEYLPTVFADIPLPDDVEQLLAGAEVIIETEE
jgi:thymidylate synthase (FAD)